MEGWREREGVGEMAVRWKEEEEGQRREGLNGGAGEGMME